MRSDGAILTLEKVRPLTEFSTARDPAILPRALFFLAVALALLVGGLAARPTTSVFSTPLTEDAFYSLTVARNIALGNGVTIDGVQPTNGFQPLFTLIEAGAYYLSGNVGSTAVRIIFAVSFAIWLMTGHLVGAIAANLSSAPGEAPGLASARRWVATLLYLGGFLTFMHHFNGLETGLLMLLYAVLWRSYQVGWLERRFGPALFGVLLGLLVLTRIDAAVFVALFVGWRLLGAARAGRWRTGLIESVVIGGLALVVSAPWWWFNYHTFGTLMPTSGRALELFEFDEGRWRWIAWALAVDAMPTLWFGELDELFHHGLPTSLFRATVALGLILWFRRRVRSARLEGADARRARAFGLLLLTGMGVLAIYYGANFIAAWFYYRYLFPVALAGSVAIAWTVAPLATRLPWRAAALIALLSTPTLVSATMAYGGKTLHVETVYWDQYNLVRDYVPISDSVASSMSGTLGYFRRKVINIDGKVNSEALAHQDEMWTYLNAKGVRWYCDWHYFVEKYLGADPAANGWKLVASNGVWQLWRHDGP